MIQELSGRRLKTISKLKKTQEEYTHTHTQEEYRLGSSTGAACHATIQICLDIKREQLKLIEHFDAIPNKADAGYTRSGTWLRSQ